MMLTAEELLAGAGLTYEVEVPAALLLPAPGSNGAPRAVRLRPLTVHDLQLIARAARDSDTLSATLLVQRALLEPALSVPQVSALPAGLVQFLVRQVNQVSGLTVAQEHLSGAAEAPLVKAAFLLAREFGWTPQQVNELTLGQVLLHLQMLRERARHDAR
jgi:hypothetical protein